MFNEIKKELDWNGNQLRLSTGKIARHADGAILIEMDKSAILCTVTAAKQIKEDASFFPLTVNYQEKSYAAGKIPGGFLKRESGRSDKEMLISRLIDRPLRPLFHKSFFNETQIICNVHSLDEKGNTDILALIGASAALAISGLPYTEIVAASRVGMIDGQFVLNPDAKQLQKSKLDLVVAGTRDSVMMVESEAEFLTEKEMIEAVKFGHQGFQSIIELITELKKEIGKPVIEVAELLSQNLIDEVTALTKDSMLAAFSIKETPDRSKAISQIGEQVQVHFSASTQYTPLQINTALAKVKSELLRQTMLGKETRIDGRQHQEIRDIECEISLFSSTHGSSLFTRGETQSLVCTTLGTGQDEQIIDDIEGEYKENFLLNYVFPQYSVGEVGPLKAPTRREIGHGKLAWRALKRALPSKDEFPYTVRVVSEITACNGSSSMATICGSSMSMLDAGIPLKKPIAGIAMGLIKEGDKYIILSDIIASEDQLGDMDFKVAGSSDGVTALQMDIKMSGITFDIMEKALMQAKDGRVHILNKMSEAISNPAMISTNAPMIESFTINKDKIRDIIGPGGKIIREICDQTEAKIDINDDGQVTVSAIGKTNLDAAIAKVKSIAFDPEIGSVFEGTVVKILESGAFVNYQANRDGFLHISEISHEHVKDIDSVLSEGQKVKVKLIAFERGKAKLTIKNVDADLDTIMANQRPNFNRKKDKLPPRRNDKYPKQRDYNDRSNFSKDAGADNSGKRKYFN